MILGMSTSTFTLLHVLISLIGILSGLVVVFGLIKGMRLDGLTVVFLSTTALTSATGFAFPVEHIMPSHIIGIISLVVLAVATAARYGLGLAGAWRRTYVIGAVVALYFNVFVLVVQCFRRAPFLKALAPTQTEPPFLVAQLVVMGVFIALGVYAAKGFRAEQALRAAARA